MERVVQGRVEPGEGEGGGEPVGGAGEPGKDRGSHGRVESGARGAKGGRQGRWRGGRIQGRQGAGGIGEGRTFQRVGERRACRVDPGEKSDQEQAGRRRIQWIIHWRAGVF